MSENDVIRDALIDYLDSASDAQLRFVLIKLRKDYDQIESSIAPLEAQIDTLHQQIADLETQTKPLYEKRSKIGDMMLIIEWVLDDRQKAVEGKKGGGE